MRRVAFAFSVSLGLLAPAAAASLDQCQEPYGPVLPRDPAAVTTEQLKELKKEVEAFIADSDVYQSCLIRLMAITKKEDKLSDGDRAKAQRKIESNQREKEAIGNAYNALAKAVNARGG